MSKCPECGEPTRIVTVSSGGDDMELCTKCNWVEDFSKPPLQKEDSGVQDGKET